MHPRAARVVSVAPSLAVHVLVLVDLYRVTIVRPDFPNQPPLPVRILDVPPPKPPPRRAPPQPAPPPVAAPPAPAPAPAPEPPPPEQKIPLPEQQIVSPSEGGKNEPPPETRFLSDRDTRVEEQMMRRGQPAPGTGESAAPAAKEAEPEKAARPSGPERGGRRRDEPPPQVAALPGLDRLLPNALRLAEEGYGEAAQAGSAKAEPEANAHRALGGSDGIWIPASGPIGTLDFLPDVREGDITLLNTKAELFAPFVRRVALRVFQNFWISLRRELSLAELSTTESVEAEAIMDPRGEMVGFRITQRSARVSLATDRRLQQACNDAFFDRNPPPGARAKDGNIHFVLRAHVAAGPSPRGMAYWVTFQTGLL